jgi:hypothetical protein
MQIDKFNSLTKTKYWSYQSKKFRSSFLLSRIKNFLKNIINKLFLNKFGFMIVQKSSTYRAEQKSYTKNSKILFIRNQQIANFLTLFCSGFGIKLERVKLIKNIERYDELFRTVKISDLSEGMGYNNGLLFYVLISHFQPKLVLESGTYKGFSTFLIDDATSSDSKIFCFDINLNRREFLSKKATYFENDLSLVSEVDFCSLDFAFFDDHVSIYDRLKFSLENKIEVVIVDDDVGLTQVHSDGWPPIPTASMIFNYDKIPKKFDWINNGITAKADIAGLKIDDICDFYKYIRFPQLSEYTGYKDTSYTSLLLKR